MDIINTCAKNIFYALLLGIAFCVVILVAVGIALAIVFVIENFPFLFFGAFLLFAAYGGYLEYKEEFGEM